LKTPSEGCAPLATPTDQLTKAASRLATWDLFCWQLFTTGAAERFTAEEREWVLDQLLHLAMAFAKDTLSNICGRVGVDPTHATSQCAKVFGQ
jgi:hypothetical protein